MQKNALHLLIFAMVFGSFPSMSGANSYTFSMNSPIGQALAPLPENQWIKLNSNRFQDVWASEDQRPTPGGPYSIIQAWSSMAWDGNRGDLIFWGGGHANYPGNEVYRWRASTLCWERASLPSDVRQVGAMPYHFEPVDGMLSAPIAAHTYDNSEFLPIADRWVTFGGAVFNGGAQFRFADGTPTGPYFWDPSRANGNQVGGSTGSHVNPQLFPDVVGGQMWENRNNIQFGDYVDGATGYARENGKDVLYIQAMDSLVKYTISDINDPSHDTYEKVGKTSIALSGQGAGAFDPDRNLFLRTSGPGVFTYWRLDSPGPLNGNIVLRPRVLNGSFDFYRLVEYGLDYDSVRAVYLLWNGDPEVWVLKPPNDLATGEWILYPEAIGSAVAPNRNAFGDKLTGVLGKWKYVRELDVFLGVFDHFDGDIWAYKPKNWQPVPADNHAPYLLSPRKNDYFMVGSTINIVAGVIDADRSIEKIEFFSGTTKLGEDYSAPYEMAWENVSAGIHNITAVAIDRNTKLISKSVKITVSNIDPTIKSVVLRDGLNGYNGTLDAYLYEYGENANTNFGHSTDLIDFVSKSSYTSLVRFAVFESEVGPVPNGAIIESAILSLYKISSYNYTYRVHPLLKDWKEYEVTWNRSMVGMPWTIGGAKSFDIDLATAPDGEGSVGWDSQWLNIDVTAGIQRISNGVTPNFGWRLVPVSGNWNMKVFLSREYSDPTLRPMLTVKYREVDIGNIRPSVVIQSPSNGLVTSLGETVNISAEAMDSDGTISMVEFFQGTSKLGESSVAPYTFTWTPTQAGAYTLTAVATDNLNVRTTSSAVNVTILGGNAAPLIAMTTPVDGATFIQGEPVVLGATASDADGHIVKVEFYQGATKLGESSSYPYFFSWIAPQAGVYSLSAVATDNSNITTMSNTVTVTVTEATTLAQTVVLRDGHNGYSGTRDAHMYSYHGDINFGQRADLIDFVARSSYISLLRFAVFESEGGPVPDGAVIELATLSLYKLSSYNYTYRVHPLLKDWKEYEVTWNRSMAGMLWAAGGAGSYGSDLAVAPDGEGSVGWNPQWLNIDVTAGIRRISNGVTPNFGWRLVPVSGNSNMKVFNSREYQADPSLRPTLTIKFRAGNGTGNVKPSVAVTAPINGSVFSLGETVNISAEAMDSDGTISMVEFFQGTSKLGESSVAPYTFTWTPTQAGAYTLTAVATDNLNVRTTSSAVNVTILGGNAAPLIAMTTPVDGATFIQGEPVVLGATASDADGHIVKVEFYQGATKLGESSSYPYFFSWIAPQAGVYSLSAVATDNSNITTMSNTVTVTVTEATTLAQTVVLRDGHNGYSGTRDAHMYSYHGDINFGQRADLIDFVARSSYISLLRFAVFESEGGPVPDGAVIELATLSLYKLSSYNYTYRVHPLLKDWKEYEVTWNRSMAGMLWAAGGAGSYGSDLAVAPDGEGSVGWNPQWLNIDVTAGIRRISNGVTPNFGWRLVPVSGNSNMKVFNSREYQADPSLRPTLTIKFRAGI